MNSVLDFFAAYVLHGRQIPRDTYNTVSTLATERPEQDNAPFNRGGKIFELIRNVHIFHCKVRQNPPLNATNVSEALQIWHELESWDPGEGTSAPEQFRLNSSYRSAIFIWTYFTIYPGDMEGWKPQEAVHDILTDLSGIGVPGIGPLIAIPLFFCGLSATKGCDRNAVRREYERLGSHTQSNSLGASWSIVQRRWREYDGGHRNNWDWV